jgi:hypothetical protein
MNPTMRFDQDASPFTHNRAPLYDVEESGDYDYNSAFFYYEDVPSYAELSEPQSPETSLMHN